MERKVVYFTRTKTSERVAMKIAARLSCECLQITDNVNWQGLIGYIKAGYYSSSNRRVDIKISGEVGTPAELIIVSPLWAGGLPPATRVFLESVPLDTVHLVVTSNGSKVKQRSDYKSVSDITRNDKNKDTVVDKLIERLRSAYESTW